MRALATAALLAVSGCATFPDAHLVSLRTRLAVQRAEAACGPVAFRRAALGSRWGEYLTVTVHAPAGVSGEARLYVDRRPTPSVRFTTTPWDFAGPTPEGAPVTDWRFWSSPLETPLLAGAQRAVVVDVKWPNERLDVDAALPRNAPLELSIGGLTSATPGGCAGVSFTVEQGVLQPTIGERAWEAELARRGGPAWEAEVAARAQHAEALRQAHYAAVDARRAADRSMQAERAAVAEALRQQHYAAWAQRREARFSVEADVQVAAGGVSNAGALAAEAPAPASSPGVVAEVAGAGGAMNLTASCSLPGPVSWPGGSRAGTEACADRRPETAGQACAVAAASAHFGADLTADGSSCQRAPFGGGTSAWAETYAWQQTPVPSPDAEARAPSQPTTVGAVLEPGLTATAGTLEAEVSVVEPSAPLTAPPVGLEASADVEWLASWPMVDARVEADAAAWPLPSCFERVAVVRDTEVLPSPPAAVELTVDGAATADVVAPWLGFISAALTGLVRAVPAPPQPVHRAVPAKR